MEFDFSKEQIDLYESVVAFCEERLQYDVVALDAAGTFPETSGAAVPISACWGGLFRRSMAAWDMTSLRSPT